MSAPARERQYRKTIYKGLFRRRDLARCGGSVDIFKRFLPFSTRLRRFFCFSFSSFFFLETSVCGSNYKRDFLVRVKGGGGGVQVFARGGRRIEAHTSSLPVGWGRFIYAELRLGCVDFLKRFCARGRTRRSSLSSFFSAFWRISRFGWGIESWVRYASLWNVRNSYRRGCLDMI